MSGDVVAIALALVALVLSVLAYRSAAGGRGGRLGAGGHALRVRVTDGQARRRLADDTREYGVLVQVINRSATAVTISKCQLRVTYRTRANFLGAVDLDPQQDVHPTAAPRPVLELPAVVPPRSTLARWVFFTTSNVIPRHCRVQDYAIVVSSPDGQRTIEDASLPALLAADTDGQGPPTWGWD